MAYQHVSLSEGNAADPRDRLIIALYAQLKAERETREALEWVIRNGVTSKEVLEAIAGDPIPAVDAEDVALIDMMWPSEIHDRRETGSS